ncbi:transcription factor 23-like [Saccostrea echinata]|uniref:transcription factor 23-like n=1 Tax=Saccostrea echinata TaxID=191078 RepID=UPI002A82A439|nr:transcription factor 23-like [Saccostrea echinata]
MCESKNAMMHQYSAENYYSFATENSHFGPERGYRKIRPIIAGNAARERSRVKTLRSAFLELQRTLPAVPPDTKLSKLDVLVLATTYIAHLMRTLNEGLDDNQLFAANGIMHPVKKWPMRSRLYAGILTSAFPVLPAPTSQKVPSQSHPSNPVGLQTSTPPWESPQGSKSPYSVYQSSV